MRRTQIYLDESLYSLLKRESREKGKTVSEIIRERLWKTFESDLNRKEALLEAAKEVFGIWKDREFDVESCVRTLREDREIDSAGY
ncbi:MAG: CopG family transcriptional regulator [Desulfurobacterium sp.]|nr:MAG: CopG family transcriptional regulator [Desulfurobacterium sp.]